MTYAPSRPTAHAHSRRTAAAPHCPAQTVRAHTRAGRHTDLARISSESEYLRIQCSERNDYTLVQIAGELDVSTADQARDALHAVLAVAGPRLVLDLANLRFIGSSGITEFLCAGRLAARSGGWLRLARASDFVQDLLYLLELTDRLPAYESATAAAAGAAAMDIR